MENVNAVKNVFSGNGNLDNFMTLAILFASGGKPQKGEAYEVDSKKSKDWRDHEDNVSGDLRSKNENIGEQVILEIKRY